MTKLDQVIERIRQLPQERQDWLADEMEFILRDDAEGDFLTPEQRAELNRRVAEPATEYIPHDEVVAFFEKKYGK